MITKVADHILLQVNDRQQLNPAISLQVVINMAE
jgi:hypothetical protein